MDDYEAAYRIRGLQILPSFLRIPTPVLHRTGIAQLLLRSIQHSISLHTTAPEPLLLEPSLKQLFQLLHTLYPEGQGKEEEVAKNIEQAVERGIINGWAYSKSGKEGVESSIGVARAVELVCRESELGVIRWMKVSFHFPLRIWPFTCSEHHSCLSSASLSTADVHPSAAVAAHYSTSTLCDSATTCQSSSFTCPAHHNRENRTGSQMAWRDTEWCRDTTCRFERTWDHKRT